MMKTYHKFSKAIHWITALIVLGLLSVGFIMTGMEYGESKFKLYYLHKSFGLLILILLGLRMAVFAFKGKPKSLKTHKPWEKGLSHLVHVLLYGILLAMPLSGWIMSSAGDFPISFFGLEVPDIASKDKGLFNLSREAHEIMAFVLVAIIGLHILGALKHHFMDRDETLQRMTSKNLGLKGGAILAAMLLAFYAPSVFLVGSNILHEISEPEAEHAEAEHLVESVSSEEHIAKEGISSWALIDDKSEIKITTTQYGQEFSGKFTRLKGEIFFDPENLKESKARIEIPVTTFLSGSDDRDAQAMNESWFYAEKYPVIIFETTGFEMGGGEGYFLAKGNLTIRGVTLSIDLPFELKIGHKDDSQYAEMKAKIGLKRLDFGVGQGEWQKTDVIADDVALEIDVQAKSEK